MATTKRSFWLHQVCEYVIAGFLASAATQSSQPAPLALLALLILVNAAIVQGPVSAFQFVSRSVHRILDVAMIVIMLATALLTDLNASARITVLGLTALLGMIVIGTNYAKTEPRVRSRGATGTPSDRSEQFAKNAGRTVGRIGRAIKDRNQ
ncbi:MAG: hypothetical protein ACOVK5_03560 [Ilumatobacteraceae bacterium]